MKARARLGSTQYFLLQRGFVNLIHFNYLLLHSIIFSMLSILSGESWLRWGTFKSKQIQTLFLGRPAFRYLDFGKCLKGAQRSPQENSAPLIKKKQARKQ